MMRAKNYETLSKFVKVMPRLLWPLFFPDTVFHHCFYHRCRNDFSVEEAKIVLKNNPDNQIQSITLCNMYFSKKRYTQCTMGSGAKPPEAGEFSRIFVLKVTLQSVGLLLTVSYRKNWGSRMY